MELHAFAKLRPAPTRRGPRRPFEVGLERPVAIARLQVDRGDRDGAGRWSRSRGRSSQWTIVVDAVGPARPTTTTASTPPARRMPSSRVGVVSAVSNRVAHREARVAVLAVGPLAKTRGTESGWSSGRPHVPATQWARSRRPGRNAVHLRVPVLADPRPATGRPDAVDRASIDLRDDPLAARAAPLRQRPDRREAVLDVDDDERGPEAQQQRHPGSVPHRACATRPTTGPAHRRSRGRRRP